MILHQVVCPYCERVFKEAEVKFSEDTPVSNVSFKLIPMHEAKHGCEITETVDEETGQVLEIHCVGSLTKATNLLH